MVYVVETVPHVTLHTDDKPFLANFFDNFTFACVCTVNKFFLASFRRQSWPIFIPCTKSCQKSISPPGCFLFWKRFLFWKVFLTNLSSFSWTNYDFWKVGMHSFWTSFLDKKTCQFCAVHTRKWKLSNLKTCQGKIARLHVQVFKLLQLSYHIIFTLLISLFTLCI